MLLRRLTSGRSTTRTSDVRAKAPSPPTLARTCVREAPGRKRVNFDVGMGELKQGRTYRMPNSSSARAAFKAAASRDNLNSGPAGKY